jgi:membrane peptidoglycan carboxypeptidase
VGAIKLGIRLGEERFYRYIQAFGFGTKTGVDLPGEERGLLKPPARWSGISIGEISMGQEIGVTPLQMVGVYSAIANGGILFQPRIVHDVFLGAQHEPLAPATGRRVISPRTAEMMRAMLAAVVDHGTGEPAQLGGYTSAGKTGTAQKIDAGAYSKSHFVASFIGFAPAIRPAVTILVVIDSPVGVHHGTEVAAPVFRSIAEQTLGYLNVPQDNPSRWPQFVPPKPTKPLGQKPEDLVGFLPPDRESIEAATSPVSPASFSRRTAPARLAARALSDGDVDSSAVILGDGPLVTIPDFSGWAARRVAGECEKLGLDLNVTGSGLAVEQNPIAGLKVPSGTRIWVHLAR